MSGIGQLVIVRTDPATQFRGALVTDAALTLDITPPPDGTPQGDGFADAALVAGGPGRSRLRSIGLWSVENLYWEIWLWGNDDYTTPTLVSSGLYPIARHAFVATDGLQIAGVGAFYYYVDGLNWPYRDVDVSSEVHLMLVNRSGGAKTANDGGAIQIQLAFEIPLGH